MYKKNQIGAEGCPYILLFKAHGRMRDIFCEPERRSNVSVELNKKEVKVNEVLYSGYTKTTAEGDIIVPDINPDVLKILKVSERTYITKKSIKDSKCFVEGTVALNILYLPEDDLQGKIKAVNYSLPFSSAFPVTESRPEMKISVEAECEGLRDRLINSRKLNISCDVGISIKITSEKEISLSSPSPSEDIYFKNADIRLLSPDKDIEKEITISEKLSIPQSMPPLREILSCSLSEESSDLKLSENKAVVKGELKASVIYLAEDEDGSIQCMEDIIPFGEVFDIDSDDGERNGELDIHIKDISFKKDDYDDSGVICLDIILMLTLRTSGENLYPVIEDAYGTKKDIKIKKCTHNIEKILDKGITQFPQKEIIDIPPYLPGVKKVCDISCRPYVKEVLLEDTSAVVKGETEINVLFLTEDNDLPVGSFKETIPFSVSIPISFKCDKVTVDAKIKNEHLSYTLLSDKALEIRLINSVFLKCMCSENTELIEEIEYESNEIERPSMVIYFARQGDTLWDIAKKYHTDPNKIEMLNDIKDGIKEGDIIKIF